MALTGLQIQKLLPGTNCRECGSNTCLAFAMKLAAKKAEIALCPYASEEAVRVLGEATEPPVRRVTLGEGGALTAGEETVLYRHEKTFVSPTIIALALYDDDPSDLLESKIAALRDYRYERVGETFSIDMAALVSRGSDPGVYASLVKRVREETGRPLILKARPEVIEKCLPFIEGNRSLLCCDVDGLPAVEPAAREKGHAIALSAKDYDTLVGAAAGLRDAGFGDLFLMLEPLSLAERFQGNSIFRRAAIRDSFKAAGFPFLSFIGSGDAAADTVSAVTEIAKYGGIIVLPGFDPAQMASLMTLRMNIFTDPQKPIQVEPRVYAIGDPDDSSPVFVTTNFSLTYFIVSGEIENSGISAWLAVPDCEGMSVLTAWAAGKFSGQTIARFVGEHDGELPGRGRTIVVPGYVAQISGELEELLPGWSVRVGPQEAADIESFIKTQLTSRA